MDKRTCSVDICERDVLARGFCPSHYQRWRLTGNPLAAPKVKRNDGPCSVGGCDEQAQARGLCPKHYQRDRRYGEPGGAHSWIVTNPPTVCTVDGCEEPSRARGYCALHYNRWRQTGEPGPVGRLRAENGKGGDYKRLRYRTISVKDENGKHRSVLEHRYVMEQALGRRLLPRENVHHINGNTLDNRRENLELWVKPQPNGQRVEDLVAWIIEKYPDFVQAALDGKPHLLAV